MMPYFDRPYLLLLALLLPAMVVALSAAGVRRRRARLARLGSEEIVARLMPPAAVRVPLARVLLLSAAAALGAVALAGPRWGTEPTVVRGRGVDIVLALDASLSMLAADERPDRLERMRQEVQRVLALSSGDRIGLIAFAGRSYILTPLTIDNGAIDLYLDNLDPSVVGQAGSSLARAIRQGATLLRATTTESDRALVILSDGEAFEPREDVEEAARLAAEAGIVLITVGFGTREGATIPVREGGAVVPKRDESGNVVVSRYTPELLEAAARAADGVFIDAAATDKAGRIRRALSGLRTQQRAAAGGRDRKARFQLFLLPALLLVLLDTLLSERRGRSRRAPTAAARPSAAAALLVALSLAAWPAPLRADVRDDAARAYKAGRYAESLRLFRRAVERGDRSPRTLYNLGTAYLAADSLARAAEILERVSAAGEPELRYRALFNLGLAHLRRGLAAEGDTANAALDAAIDAYKKVLRMRSADLDAKWNLELALRRRRSGGGGGGGGGGEGGANEPQPSAPQAPQPRPAGGLGQQQAEELLNNAAREETDVQARRQRENQPQPPPGGKDW